MSGQCLVCGCMLGKGNLHQLCQAHGRVAVSGASARPSCAECGKACSPGSTRCRPCANAVRNRSPEMREASRRNMTAKQAAGMPRNDAATSARLKELYKDPAQRARLATAGEKGRQNTTPEAHILRAQRQKATKAKQRQQRMAWCPADRVEEFTRLHRVYGFNEAKRIVQDDIAAQERRRRAALTPFQRQEEALRRGATLVRKQTLRREHDFTLGGIASASL